MNYEKIILELLDRIKTLEEKVEKLEKGQSLSDVDPRDPAAHQGRFTNSQRFERKVSLTQQARDYIMAAKATAKEEGDESITLLCNDIQIDLGVTNRTPCICTAMYDCMEPGDEVISAPPSGKSTTVKVKYYLK
ncbi:hypothetical protein J6Y73_02490 [bacterium]|nr:hypothetical protein [bacterium]